MKCYKLRKLFVILVCFLAISGCSNNSDNQEIAPNHVNIDGFAFEPDTITVKKGATVTWTNLDSAEHTATSDDGLFDSGLLAKGESWSFTFEEVGSYGYYCIPHPFMTGTVVVTE